jgi:hypothetical protein
MCFRYRQLEAEDGTALRVRFRRNPAVMRGYNGPADRQAMKPEVAVLALHNRHRRVFRETISVPQAMNTNVRYRSLP